VSFGTFSNVRARCLFTNNTARLLRRSSSVLFRRCVFKSFIAEKDLSQEADVTGIVSRDVVSVSTSRSRDGLETQFQTSRSRENVGMARSRTENQTSRSRTTRSRLQVDQCTFL